MVLNRLTNATALSYSYSYSKSSGSPKGRIWESDLAQIHHPIFATFQVFHKLVQFKRFYSFK